MEDVSPANTIFGVKEFPKESLLPQKSYMIFSHTIKAQEYNMPFLDQVRSSTKRGEEEGRRGEARHSAGRRRCAT